MPDLRFTLLGPFAVSRDGADVTPSAPERRALLAALVLERGRAVDADELAAAVWPGRTPLDPTTALRPHVEALAALFGSRVGVRFAVTATDTGWRLDLPDPCTDLDDVTALERSADDHRRLGQDREAADDLRAALRLRTGDVLSGLPGPWFAARRAAAAERIEHVAATVADLVAQTPGPQSADVLRSLSAQHPRNPGVWLRRTLVEEQVAGPDAAFLVFEEAARFLGDRLDAPDAAPLRAAGARLAPPAPDPPAGVGPSGEIPSYVWAFFNLVAFAGPRSRPTARGLDPGLVRRLGVAPDTAAPLRFEVLRGPAVVVGRRRVPLVGRRQRTLLAVLLLSGGGPVLTEDLVERSGLPLTTWRQDAVHGALFLLVWKTGILVGSPGLLVLHTRRGWELPYPRDLVDLDAVRRLAAAGRDALAAGRTDLAAPVLRHVLDRVPTVPFPRLTGSWFRERRAELVAWRADLEADCVRAETARAAAVSAVDTTGRAVRADPLREDLWAEHLHALVRAGRPDEARRAFAEAQSRLESALRTGPGPTLRMLKARIDADDPSLYL